MPTRVNMYEMMYIVNAVLSDEQIKNVVSRVSAFIEKNGAELLEVDEWGSRRLAYPIEKKRNGYYVNMFFKSSGTLIARLERAMEIEDDILRYVTLKMDAKMIRHFERRQAKKVEA